MNPIICAALIIVASLRAIDPSIGKGTGLETKYFHIFFFKRIKKLKEYDFKNFKDEIFIINNKLGDNGISFAVFYLKKMFFLNINIINLDKSNFQPYFGKVILVDEFTYLFVKDKYLVNNIIKIRNISNYENDPSLSSLMKIVIGIFVGHFFGLGDLNDPLGLKQMHKTNIQLLKRNEYLKYAEIELPGEILFLNEKVTVSTTPLFFFIGRILLGSLLVLPLIIKGFPLITSVGNYWGLKIVKNFPVYNAMAISRTFNYVQINQLIDFLTTEKGFQQTINLEKALTKRYFLDSSLTSELLYNAKALKNICSGEVFIDEINTVLSNSNHLKGKMVILQRSDYSCYPSGKFVYSLQEISFQVPFQKNLKFSDIYRLNVPIENGAINIVCNKKTLQLKEGKVLKEFVLDKPFVLTLRNIDDVMLKINEVNIKMSEPCYNMPASFKNAIENDYLFFIACASESMNHQILNFPLQKDPLADLLLNRISITYRPPIVKRVIGPNNIWYYAAIAKQCERIEKFLSEKFLKSFNTEEFPFSRDFNIRKLKVSISPHENFFSESNSIHGRINILLRNFEEDLTVYTLKEYDFSIFSERKDNFTICKDNIFAENEFITPPESIFPANFPINFSEIRSDLGYVETIKLPEGYPGVLDRQEAFRLCCNQLLESMRLIKVEWPHEFHVAISKDLANECLSLTEKGYNMFKTNYSNSTVTSFIKKNLLVDQAHPECFYKYHINDILSS